MFTALVDVDRQRHADHPVALPSLFLQVSTQVLNNDLTRTDITALDTLALPT